MSGVTVVSVNEGDDRTVSGINGRGIAEQRPTQLSSFRQPDSKPQRQFITANDVRNLVSSNPASDHNQSRNETPSLTNILTNRDGTTRHNVTDFEYSDSDGCATSFSDPPIQPKCFYVGVVPASIGGALATVFVTIAIAIYLFIILHGRSGHKAGPTSFGLIGTLLAVCTLAILFAISFIYGAIKGRKRWLWPLMFLSICLCVASVGTFAAVIITSADDISETIQNATEHQTLIIVNIVVFRVAFVIFIVLQILLFICYIRCYRYIVKLYDY